MNTLDGSPVGESSTSEQQSSISNEQAAEILYKSEDSAGDNPAGSQEPAPNTQEVRVGDYSLQIPEGVIVDQAMLGEFEAMARENGLNNDQVQKIADLHLQATMNAVPLEMRQLLKEHEAEVQNWQKEVKQDPQWETIVADARHALSLMGSESELESLKEHLNLTGLNHHPVLIRGLARLSRQLKGATRQQGSQASSGSGKHQSQEWDAASILYGPTGVRGRKRS